MFETLKDFYQATSIIDLVYLLITILSLIKCYKKGFVLSILSMAKWLMAYVITLILFPRLKPYFKNIIDNEYVLDVGLGIAIFVIVIFLILLINKGISKAVNYTGIGGLDTTFGFFFGFIQIYSNNLFWNVYWTCNVVSNDICFNITSFIDFNR